MILQMAFIDNKLYQGPKEEQDLFISSSYSVIDVVNDSVNTEFRKKTKVLCDKYGRGYHLKLMKKQHIQNVSHFVMILTFFLDVYHRFVKDVLEIGLLPIIFYCYVANNHNNRILIRYSDKKLFFYIMIDRKVFKIELISCYAEMYDIEPSSFNGSMIAASEEAISIECVRFRKFDIKINPKNKKLGIDWR